MEEKRETAWGCATQNEAQRKRHCLFGEYQKKKKKEEGKKQLHAYKHRERKKKKNLRVVPSLKLFQFRC